MEGFAVLIAIMLLISVILSPILASVALSRGNKDRAKLRDLEAQLHHLQRDLHPQKDPQARFKHLKGSVEMPPEPEPAKAEPKAETPPIAPALEILQAEDIKEPAAPSPAPAAQPLPSIPTEGPAKEIEKPEGMEEKVSTRLFVWMGAVALALAAVYLVKYSIDKGILTPTTRVILGTLFGTGLLAGGEWLRSRTARISQALSAAGIASLYATVIAATNLYHLLDPRIGFGLTVLVTAAAVGLSLRQGILIAVVGLVGGFAMPAVIQTGEQRPAALFGYIFLLQAGLVAVTGIRRWWWLSAVTLLGSTVWAAFWIGGIAMGRFLPADGLWVGLFLILSSASYVVSEKSGRGRLVVRGVDLGLVLSYVSIAVGIVLTAILTGTAGFRLQDWAFVWIISAGCLALARLDPTKEGLAPLAAFSGAVLLSIWHLKGAPEALESRFVTVALAFGILHAGGSYGCLWGSRKPSWWAWLSAASLVAYFLIAWWEVHTLPGLLTWGGVSLILASLAILGAIPLARRSDRLPDGRDCVAALAAAATFFISLAVPLELERQWITVAWALEVLALAWLEARLGTKPLRFLSAFLAGLVGLRLLANPLVLTYPIGTAILWNWLLYGYGVPVLALAAAARIYDRLEGTRLLVRFLQGLATALGLVLLTLQVRQYFHPGALGSHGFFLAEWATYTIAWLLAGLGLLRACSRNPLPCLLWGGWIAGSAGLALAVLALGLIANPLFNHHPVGSLPILNGLLYLYGLPAALGLLFASRLKAAGLVQFVNWARTAAVILFFLLVNLEVRQLFQGTYLDGAAPQTAEWGTYTIAWLLVGLGLIHMPIGSTPRYFQWTGWIAGIGGMIIAFCVLGIGANPLLVHHGVGSTPVLNILLYAYGVPVILGLLFAWKLKAMGLTELSVAVRIASLLFLFLLVNLEVRQGFHGNFLDGPAPTNAEWYAYSAAWILFGAALLIAGIITGGTSARYASLVVLLAAAAKVFLFDTRELRDLYRVFSFLGLGASLLTIAFLYQRYVFRRPEK